MPRTYQNPILPGFYPDPSICRVGEDYYLVTSTFEYFPGLPIFHSRDLVNWRQIGHVLDRPSQLPLDEIRASGGLYAPTIRYHAGTFYVVNTLMVGTREKGNFIVTASNPAGPWSEPYWLENAPGIDPSLYFEDTPTGVQAWYCGNREVENAPFCDYREIWLQALDLQTMQLTGETYVLWDGALKDAVHAEASHIFKVNGYYYLLIAEGGTSHNHAITIARSQTLTGPYENNPCNPLLTHRHLGLDYPIIGTGHADMVETQNGEWWMVCLAMRPYDAVMGRFAPKTADEEAMASAREQNTIQHSDYYFNLGRETFMSPVVWENGWPIVNPGVGHVRTTVPAPNLPEHRWPTRPACDHFETPRLDYIWNFLRTPREVWYSLTERPGYLRLKLRPQQISEEVNPSFVGRRQQHMQFAARTAMEFTPGAPNEEAGLVLLQNNHYYFRFVVTASGVQLARCKRGEETVLAERPLSAKRVYLKVEAHGQAYSFYVATEAESWQPVAENVDGRILSTTVAGGFVGAYIGMYASSNGQPSNNVADFDWFEYTGCAME
ncbi:MAG: glycoside hydrolase family 43 protein [Anaerolineae bacterium]|nr:glycoside hydrolase family 43 protein [Anaerolineae bacterium]